MYSHDFNVHIISTSDIQKQQNISKPGPAIVGTAIRRDGIIAAYSNSKGEITIRDIVRKAHLKSYKKHRDPAYALEFTYADSVLISADDEKVINFFDYSKGKVVTRMEKCHDDFIRVVRAMKSSTSTFLSGGYDKIVKLWDVRVEEKLQYQYLHEDEV
jgi:WD40 repeat protein